MKTEPRRITEIHSFSKADLERAALFLAKAKIVGTMYVGDFHAQSVVWSAGGGLVVETTHTPFEWAWAATERRDRARRAGR